MLSFLHKLLFGFCYLKAILILSNYVNYHLFTIINYPFEAYNCPVI